MVHFTLAPDDSWPVVREVTKEEDVDWDEAVDEEAEVEVEGVDEEVMEEEVMEEEVMEEEAVEVVVGIV